MDCNFCGIKIPKGTDYIFVTSKGKALYFCSKKCFKNLVTLERKPRQTKWTKAYRDEKEVRLKTMEHKDAGQVQAVAVKVPEPPKKALEPKADKPDKPKKKASKPESAHKEAKPQKKSGK